MESKNSVFCGSEYVDCFLLSHGQAVVERGFLVNKDVSQQNMQSTTLISRRFIKDNLRKKGGVQNVQVTDDMLKMVNSARNRYQIDIDSKKLDKSRQDEQVKMKMEEEEVDTWRKKAKTFESDIELLIQEADAASEEAKTKTICYLLQSQMHQDTGQMKKEKW